MITEVESALTRALDRVTLNAPPVEVHAGLLCSFFQQVQPFKVQHQLLYKRHEAAADSLGKARAAEDSHWYTNVLSQEIQPALPGHYGKQPSRLPPCALRNLPMGVPPLSQIVAESLGLPLQPIPTQVLAMRNVR
jgi:hypothetical protein